MLVQSNKENFELICRFYKEIVSDLENRINYPKWTWGIHPSESSLYTAIEGNELLLFIPDDIEQFLQKKGISDWPYPFAGAAVVNSSWEDCGQISWTSENFLAIHLFAVHPLLSHLGLADRFLEEIKVYAKDNRVDSIRLDLIQGNWPADNLYERHRFENRGNGIFQPEGEIPLNFDYKEFVVK